MTQADMVRQQWGYVSGLVHRTFYDDPQTRASIEKAERLNAARTAIDAGFVPVPGAAVTVKWAPISDVEVEIRCRVNRDVDGRVSEPGWEDKPEAEVEAEEELRRRNLRGSWVMRVAFDVYAPLEEPQLTSMARDTHAALVAEGTRVLEDKERSVLLCGGVLRRHKFPPRDATWLRDGAIREATCQDCKRTVTAAELVARAKREAANGTCSIDGDALVMDDNLDGLQRLMSASCPACAAAGRE